MRAFLYLSLLMLCLIIGYSIYRRFKRDLFILLWAGLIMVVCVSMLIKVININTIPKDVYSVVEDINKKTGESSLVRVSSNDEIEVKIKDEWVESSELDMLYWVSGGIVIEYEGEKIKIMDSGLTSTIKILDRLGFLG